MAIIPLRAYNREIEGMIDNGQLDEAVAHCRHILATFPKHIATYRLLGKAHLEQQRISDATDIFQRVLSSVPDDFIANVGMSIIREDENNLDSAIWHMELAFEAQPANAAIQDELRRLYGRRDGVQPPKVRLTRGALARMYAKGGLFDQAIAELRSAISEDPNRPDLPLLLAEMYFQTNQRIEAVDMCANLIKKIPFCLEANQILAVSLPKADQSEAVKNYRQIVISMDPYFAFVGPDSLSSEQVPENAVNIERLDWKSGIQVNEPPLQPNWATSLGISIEKPSDENAPDWLKSAEAPLPTPPGEKFTTGVSPFIWDSQEGENNTANTSKPEGEIPDWMKDAGWQLATGAPTPPPEPQKPEEPAVEAPMSGELEKAEIPEWLQGIAPAGVLGEEKPSKPQGEGELSTPWLEQHQPGPTDSIVHWLEDNKPEKPRSRPVKDEAPLELPDDEVPEWLKDLEPSQPEPTQSGGTGAPTPAFTIEPNAFIEDMAVEETSATKETTGKPSPERVSEIKAALEGELPGFPTPAQPPAASLDEVPDWLKDLAGEQPVTEVEKPAEAIPAEAPEVVPQANTEVPAAVSETPVTELPSVEEIPAAEAPAFVEPLPPTETPVTPVELPSVKEQAEEVPAEAASAFIEEALVEMPNVAEQAPSAELPSTEEKITPAEISAETEQAVAPEQPKGDQLPAEAIPTSVSESPEAEEQPQGEPLAPSEPVIPEAEPQAQGEPESASWLEGLAAEQSAKAEAVPAPAEGGEIIPPEWVKLEAEPPVDETMELERKTGEAAPVPAQEVPEWVKGLGEEPEIETIPAEPEQAEATEAELPPSEELPDWLRELEEPEPEKEAAVPPVEGLVWKPEEMPDWLKEITEAETPGEAAQPAPTPVSMEVPASPEASAFIEMPSSAEAAEPEEISAPVTEPAGQWTSEETPPAGIKRDALEEPVVEAAAEIPAIEEAAEPAVPLVAQAVPAQVSEGISAPAQTIPGSQEISTEELQAISQANQTSLGEARDLVNRRQPRQAVETYSKLIQQNYQLEEIIKDLQGALDHFPVNIEMWVALGDAFFRSENLEEALSAYTKAEELVR